MPLATKFMLWSWDFISRTRARVNGVPGVVCSPLSMNAHQKIHIFDINLYSLYSLHSLCSLYCLRRGLCQQLLVNIFQVKILFAVIWGKIQIQKAENTKRWQSSWKWTLSPHYKYFDCFAYILFQHLIAPKTKSDITSPAWPNASSQS